MVSVEGFDFPDQLFYDIENQIWYLPLGDGTLRAGFTSWAANLMGGVIVFTPKRLGRDFEMNRSFAVVEGGKWVGSARAGFDGTVIAYNERLERAPELINTNPYSEGWMLVVRPARDDWQAGLVTGEAIKPTFEEWLDSGVYRERSD